MEVNFTSEILGLTVNFTNASPTPTESWEWDFGDNTPRITTENASHTYDLPGRYNVVFVASGVDGISSKIQVIEVLYSNQITVEKYLSTYMPPGLTILDPIKETLIKTWQMNIGSLLTPKIAEEVLFDDLSWPTLANALIAKLVIREAYMKSAAGALILAMNSGASNGDTSIQSSAAKKSIETGPTKVEWHDASTMVKAYLSQGATKGGSIFDNITTDICYLSSRLRVQLPFCDRLKHSPIVPQKASPIHHIHLH